MDLTWEAYCCLCGGPTVDVVNRMRRWKEEHFENDSVDEENYYWLEECVALTVFGVMEGPSLGDGTLDGDKCVVCIAKGSWGEIPLQSEKSKYREDSEKELPGIVMHYTCWDMLRPKLDCRWSRQQFLLLSAHLSDSTNLLNGIDYGPIIKNHGPEKYNFRIDEMHLIAFPDCILEIHDVNISKDIGTKDGIFARIAPDLLCYVLAFLSLPEAMEFGLASRSSYHASRHKALWQGMIEDSAHVVRFCEKKGLLQWFSSEEAAINYERISALADQVSALFPIGKTSIVTGRKRLAGEISASPFESMKVAQLKELLRSRQLSCSGSKDVLVKRLLAHDEVTEVSSSSTTTATTS